MKFTAEKPTVTGYYWVVSPRGSAILVKVVMDYVYGRRKPAPWVIGVSPHVQGYKEALEAVVSGTLWSERLPEPNPEMWKTEKP